MSVVKSKRNESDFEVFRNFYELRTAITKDLLYNDFGYSTAKAEKRMLRNFGGKKREELTKDEENRFIALIAKDAAFNEQFILDERQAIVQYLRNLEMYIFSANEIYPQQQEELTQRRIYQERALGCCEIVKQELQFTIEILPVDINKYTRFAEMLDTEQKLIKAWRKSDNKFKKNFEKHKPEE